MKAIVLLSALALISCLPATAQGTQYNYSYGSSRVVNQNQTGLYHPQATHIGPGTMSQTARGLPPGGNTGAVSNPGLPRVNMGANIRTPGDAMYQGGTVQYQQGPVIYQGGGNPGLPVSKMGANIGTPGDAMRSDLQRPQAQPRYYYRGPQQPATVMPQGSGIFYKTNSGGVATYAEHTANEGPARRF